MKKNIYYKCEISWEIINGQLKCNVDSDAVRDALVDFLMTGKYELSCDDKRGRRGEYTMILKKSSVRQNISRTVAEAWADAYLYEGDASTKTYIDFKLCEEGEED